MAEDDLALILDIGFILSKEQPILVNDSSHQNPPQQSPLFPSTVALL